ncbi:MAG TPA: SIR2 family protein [Allosphingosinicella sp.]|nr:SIR2 family protein [Allosphingosinicella sp.]
MPDIDGRVLVFAGAGASKAVSPHKFPTTKEFFDDLLPPITDDPWFTLAMQYLDNYSQLDVVDIEQVLWALQSLYSFYCNIGNPREISGFALQSGLAERLFPGNSCGQLVGISSQIKRQLEELIGRINQVVYDLYGYEPSTEEIESNWIELISRFDGAGTRLDIFTTNYDVAIEAALNNIQGDVTAREWRGIRGSVRQTLDLSYWGDGSKIESGLLTKLHGSLDWKLRGDEIHVGDAVFTGDHAKQAIIYPGFKGASEAIFFRPFHDYLAQSLGDSAVVIFIGFAFRDEHINQIIRENIQPSSKVFVINPDKRVRFPSKRVKVRYLSSGFDGSVVKTVTENVLGW